MIFRLSIARDYIMIGVSETVKYGEWFSVGKGGTRGGSMWRWAIGVSPAYICYDRSLPL